MKLANFLFLFTVFSPFTVSSSELQVREDVNDCANYEKLQFLNPPRNYKTGLVSMPGSGNTWLLHLIQIATGIFAGSVYHNYWLDKFQHYEVNNGSVIVIKDHFLEFGFHHNLYDKNILLVRDPLEASTSPSKCLASKIYKGL